jgi:molybdopterin/thiamine biosynthesis adenylyltransferase
VASSAPASSLTEAQIERYARHILLPHIGGRGQRRLLDGAVGVAIGRGDGAAVAALAYLAAAGVGRLALGGDADGPVAPEDVAAGVLYGAADLGRPRRAALRDRIAALNPDVEICAADAPCALWLEPTGEATDTLAAALIAGGRAAARAIDALVAAP